MLISYIPSNYCNILATIKASGLSGIGGPYNVQFHIDGALVVPDRPVSIAAGIESVVFQSRSVLLAPNDHLTITLTGRPPDTSVDVQCFIVDASPVTADQVSEITEPLLEAAITEAIRNLNITVRPTTTVIGACDKNTVQMPNRFKKAPVNVTPPIPKNQ